MVISRLLDVQHKKTNLGVIFLLQGKVHLYSFIVDRVDVVFLDAGFSLTLT